MRQKPKASPATSYFSMKTPFYFYDLTLLERTLSALARSAGRHDVAIHYALKANNHPRILQTVAAAGFGADCVSGGEIEAAIEAGFPASDIFFAGVGKSDEEILLSLEARIGAFVVESVPELLNIERLAGSKNDIAPILFRLNPEVDAHTHSHITTGLAENKFGLLPEDALALMPHLLQSGSLVWRGLHFHIGSQIRSAKVFEELCEKTNRILASFRTAGYSPDIIDMGGGLGINYDEPEAEPIPDFATYIERYRRMIETGEARLHIEPGRSVVAQCGSLITQVLYIKEGKAKKFAIVDAGMTDLVRPALYEAHHQIRLVQPGEWTMRATSLSAALTEKYDVVGPICESSDVFERELLMPELKRGDYLAIRSAGAYGAVMASSYNMRPLPGSLFSDEQ